MRYGIRFPSQAPIKFRLGASPSQVGGRTSIPCQTTLSIKEPVASYCPDKFGTCGNKLPGFVPSETDALQVLFLM